MAYKLQLKRGLTSALPTGSAGEPLFTTDTNDLYIGTGAANQRYQKYIASGSSSQFLKGDGSLDSTTYTPTSRTLTINGTAYDLSADRTWNVGTVTTAAATTGGQVSFFNGATVITSVSGLYFDGVDKLGIGNSSPAFNLDVTGTARMTGNLTAASIIKSGGTSSQYLMADGSTSTLTNPVTGTGTTNYLPKWTSGSALGNSAITDDGTTVALLSRALSGSTATFKGGNAGNIKIDNDGSRYVQLLFERNTASNSGADFLLDGTNGTFGIRTLAAYPLTFSISLEAGTPVEQMRLTSTGLGIGTTSPGAKLDVVGEGIFSGFLTAGNSILIKNTINAYAYQNFGANTGFGWQIGKADNSGGIAPSNGFYIYDLTNSATRMVISQTGNMGLGVVPSAWSLGKAFEINSAGNNIWSYSNDNIYLNQNSYYNSGWKYGTSATAAQYVLFQGQHLWFTAPSGTAGNAISFTQAMTLDASGNLGLGTTSPSAKFHVVGSSMIQSMSGTAINIRGDETLNSNFGITWSTPTYTGGLAAIRVARRGASDASDMMFFTAPNGDNVNERLRITSGGSLLLGTTLDPGYGRQTASIYNSNGGILQVAGSSTTALFYVYQPDNLAVIGTTTNHPFALYTNNTERMRIKSDGKINFSSLPTSASGLSSGDIWNDGGTLKIV